MKSFGQKPWMLPQPVLIIGTYDKEGRANAMNAAWGGTWDMHEIMISLGSHATTDNLKENVSKGALQQKMRKAQTPTTNPSGSVADTWRSFSF